MFDFPRRAAVSGVMIAAGFIGLTVAGLVLARVESPSAPGVPTVHPALPVATLPVRLQRGFEMRRVFSGRVQARRASSLGFETTGRLARVLVDEGAQVDQGELLAELDTARLEARRAELDAALAEAEAGLALANATLKRLRGVVDKGGVSRQGLDEAREAQRMAAAAVALARQRIASVSVELSKTRLYAPFAGNVVERRVDEGQVLGTGDPVVRIQERATPEIRVGIAGRVVDQLRPGEHYTLVWRDRPFRARLRALLPLRAAITRTVDALFDPVDGDLRLLPGDIVTLNLATPVEEPGIWLPIDALSEGERGLWSVYVVTEASDRQPPPGIAATHWVVRRTVDVLYQETDRVFVDGALSDGERVITGGPQRIVAGQWVRLGTHSEHTGGRPS